MLSNLRRLNMGRNGGGFCEVAQVDIRSISCCIVSKDRQSSGKTAKKGPIFERHLLEYESKEFLLNLRIDSLKIKLYIGTSGMSGDVL